MRALAPSFPREVAFPNRRICITEKDFYSFINRYNKIKNVYYSLYACDDKHGFDTSALDKAAFDFDSKDPKSLVSQILKFSDDLLNLNLKHLIVYSGKKGFHVYIMLKNGRKLQFKKDTLHNVHLHLVEQFKITPDPQLFGDIKRVLRVPNTLHMSSGRYCIPITRDDLKLGMDHIMKKAEKQCFDYTFYGKEEFDVAAFDKISITKRYDDVNIPAYKNELKLEESDETIKKFLPCVQHWLLNAPTPMLEESGTWEARYQFALYCRDLGIPKDNTYRLAKRYFGAVKRSDDVPNNFAHMLKVKTVELAFTRDDFFWNCDTLFAKGLCPGRCKHYKKNGSPLYK